MNTYDALKLIALKGAIKPDAESNVRYVLRWYSKTFHTPLHEVYNLPLEDVWFAYFEERYSDMERADLEEEVAMALESPEARDEREMAEEVEKAQDLTFAKLAEESNKNMANLPKAISQVQDAIQAMKSLQSDTPSVIAETAPIVEEDIQMEFIDEEEMEKIVSEGGMATKTKGFFR